MVGVFLGRIVKFAVMRKYFVWYVHKPFAEQVKPFAKLVENVGKSTILPTPTVHTMLFVPF